MRGCGAQTACDQVSIRYDRRISLGCNCNGSCSPGSVTAVGLVTAEIEWCRRSVVGIGIVGRRRVARLKAVSGLEVLVRLKAYVLGRRSRGVW
jgi:hypothetical protein